MNLNLIFPPGTNEKYTAISELPAMPHAGDFIQSSRPGCQRYRIKAVIIEVGDMHGEDSPCESITAEVERAA
jgi:hypothetical protein